VTEIQADLSRFADRTDELRKDLRRLIVEIESHCPRDPELERANEEPERPENVFQYLKYLRSVPAYLNAMLADFESNWYFNGLEIELRGLATVTESELQEMWVAHSATAAEEYEAAIGGETKYVGPATAVGEQKGRDRVEEKRDWHDRLEDLSESLLEAGIDWNPWRWNRVIRVRRGSHLPPELVADMKSRLEMLRAIVARSIKVEELRKFLRQCEANARKADPALAERWLELAERTSITGEVYLEEADALTVEELGERIFRIEAVAPEEAWPEAEPSLPGPDGPEIDPLIRSEPEPRPAAALRSLGALVRAWDRGDLEPG
jgi:hypothetical protein